MKTQKVIDIGARRELFVDDFMIEELEGGAELRLHEPTARKVVMVHDEPWEGNTCGYHTIFKDGDLYRMYYRGSNHPQTHPPFACYAESGDGIHWTKPDLGLVAFEGSKKNNILLEGIGTHNFTPFKDPNPACLRGAQYKALGRGQGAEKSTLFAFRSADGIHWELMQSEPVITEGAMDSQNLAFWDAVRGEYRCYLRDFRDGYRGIRTCRSKDFLAWSDPLWLHFPDAPREHLYTNQVQPYYRAPHIYIGFPSRFVPDRGSLVEPLFMSSRDGRTFHRWEESIIRPGRNSERWHNRSNYVWWGLVPTDSPLPGAGQELSLYTNERYYYEGKGVRIRRYTYRPDGFVSAHAPFSGGRVLTKPFTFVGTRLLLNVSTSAAGSVRVEIKDAQGEPIDGFRLTDCQEIYGDEIERLVEWEGGRDVGDLQGRAIRLLFVLEDADIYAFRFAGDS
ncbi:MAG: hypothetical protein U9R48_11160 [Chloroflexota bacterium]|nr:hypothetical protein [Chloroflexota bacterium]